MTSAQWRLLLDQGLPRGTANHLSSAGADVIHVGTIGLWSSSDAQILDEARRQDRIIVTHDADFHSLIAVSLASKPSVIRLRLEGLNDRQIADVIQKVLTRYPDDLRRGALVSVTERLIRVRRLPIDG